MHSIGLIALKIRPDKNNFISFTRVFNVRINSVFLYSKQTIKAYKLTIFFVVTFPSPALLFTKRPIIKKNIIVDYISCRASSLSQPPFIFGKTSHRIFVNSTNYSSVVRTISPSHAPFNFVVDDRKCGVVLVCGGGAFWHWSVQAAERHTYTHGAVHTHKERYQVYNISMINLCTVTMCVTGVLWRISSDGKCVSALSSGGGNVGVVPSCDCLHSDQLHVDGYRFFFIWTTRVQSFNVVCVSLTLCLSLCVCVCEWESCVEPC